MVSQKIRKMYPSHTYKPLGRPSNLTWEMELKINKDIDQGFTNYKLLKKYPIGLVTLREIRDKRVYFSDYP